MIDIATVSQMFLYVKTALSNSDSMSNVTVPCVHLSQFLSVNHTYDGGETSLSPN